jgi:hypothetical protein
VTQRFYDYNIAQQKVMVAESDLELMVDPVMVPWPM